jgi:hypothetical protein
VIFVAALVYGVSMRSIEVYSIPVQHYSGTIPGLFSVYDICVTAWSLKITESRMVEDFHE